MNNTSRRRGDKFKCVKAHTLHRRNDKFPILHKITVYLRLLDLMSRGLSSLMSLKQVNPRMKIFDVVINVNRNLKLLQDVLNYHHALEKYFLVTLNSFEYNATKSLVADDLTKQLNQDNYSLNKLKCFNVQLLSDKEIIYCLQSICHGEISHGSTKIHY